MSTSATIPPFDFRAADLPPAPPLRGLFVTGTDTEVGKTLIAGAIARSLRRRGVRVDVLKPVATGCRRAGGQLVSADAEFLAWCADSPQMLSDIAPIRYATAVAPNVAAELERRPVDLQLLFDAVRLIAGGANAGHTESRGVPRAGPVRDASRHMHALRGDSAGKYARPTGDPVGDARPTRLVLVEGIGGLLCPITDDLWVIHLARWLGLPLLVVARAGLGTLNHTLLTLHAARSAGLHVAGVVLNRYLIDPLAASGKTLDELHARGDVDMAMFTNPARVEALGRTRVLALVPEEAANSVERPSIGPDTQFLIDQVAWQRLCGGAG